MIIMNNSTSGVEYAKRFEGLQEVADNRQLRKIMGSQGFDIDPAHTPWCAAFINAMEKMAGKEGTGKLNARSFLTYGKVVRLKDAKEGDIVIFSRGGNSWMGHVTYFIKYNVDENTITVLGGNQSDRVCYKNYPANKLLGIRRS